jgi:RNase adaptor protein for sRNA GlmZ degradation
MSETLSVEPTLRVHFGLERKRNLGNYEHTVASANVSSDISASADQSEIIAKIASLAAAVKLAVLNELGIEATFVDGTVVEAAPVVAAQLSVAEAKEKLEKAFTPDEPQTVHTQTDSFDWGKVPADVVADFKANPSNYYDNREAKASGKYKPNAADLKRKSPEASFWIKSKF